MVQVSPLAPSLAEVKKKASQDETAAKLAATKVSKPAIAPSGLSEVRPLSAADLPEVAQLFKKTFRPGVNVPLQDIVSYFMEVFLDGPDHDPACPSLVHVSAGREVSGFIGAIAQPMAFGSRQVRAVHACNLMVADPRRDSMAGARLLRSVISKPDFCFSEGANSISRQMWVTIGGHVTPTYSLKWIRPLRPVAAAIAMSAERLSLLRLLHPVGALADSMLSRTESPLALTLPSPVAGYTALEVDRQEMVEVMRQLAAMYQLRPAWTPGQLERRLEHAEHMPAFGDLVCVKVMNRQGRLVGGYLYYTGRNRIAIVLQVLAQEKASSAVFLSLLRHAKEKGAVSIWGRVQPGLLDAALQARCIILNGGFTTVYSKEKEILDAVARGDAVLAGLAGELWSHFVGGLIGPKPEQRSRSAEDH